jgi:hypothetical protein
MLAAERGHRDTVHFLLRLRHVHPEADESAVIEMCLDREAAILKMLLEDGRADPSARDNVALLYCASEARQEQLQLLLEDNRVDPNARDGLGVQLACRHGYYQVYRLFEGHPEVDLTLRDGAALREALDNATTFYHMSILLSLLKKECMAKFVTSKRWLKKLKSPMPVTAAHLLWSAVHHWRKHFGMKPMRGPSEFAMPEDVSDLDKYLNHVNAGHDASDRRIFVPLFPSSKKRIVARGTSKMNVSSSESSKQ